MTAIEGFDEDIAEELRARAKDALLTQAIASEEELGAHEPAEDLLTMDGMDRHLALFWPVADCHHGRSRRTGR